jgi:hypothetical protein
LGFQPNVRLEITAENLGVRRHAGLHFTDNSLGCDGGGASAQRRPREALAARSARTTCTTGRTTTSRPVQSRAMR